VSKLAFAILASFPEKVVLLFNRFSSSNIGLNILRHAGCCVKLDDKEMKWVLS
jgi:hypothetical protein